MPLTYTDGSGVRRLLSPPLPGATPVSTIDLLTQQPANLLNTLNTPTQTVLPVASTPVLVPDPVTDPGAAPVTTAVIQTGTGPANGLLNWAKENPLMAALVVGGGLYLLAKAIKK